MTVFHAKTVDKLKATHNCTADFKQPSYIYQLVPTEYCLPLVTGWCWHRNSVSVVLKIYF